MAVQMNQPQINEIVRAPVLLGKHMMDVRFLAIFEVLATDRAEAVLPLEQLPIAIIHSGGSASPLAPIVL
jgi:hypothetical protein